VNPKRKTIFGRPVCPDVKSLHNRGSIAFLSQSGALLTSVLDWAVEEGIGFSKLVSLENRADVTEPFYGLLGGLRYSFA